MALGIHAAAPHARTTLERLARDSDVRVANQAFAVYESLFFDVDFVLAQKAFQRGDFDRVGHGVIGDLQVFRNSTYWRRVFHTTADDAERATAVRALGLLQDKTMLTEFAAWSTKQPYLLAQLAVALWRLGNEEAYLAKITALLELPVHTALYYQTFAIDCLFQTHPHRARSGREEIDKLVQEIPDLQPNWVYAHSVRELRLP